ncbi:YceI family protein [Colwellia sp. MEBiC06753]
MRLLTLFLSCCLSLPAMANWSLSNDFSKLSFISTKKADIAEVHYFKTLSGDIAESGEVTLRIDLASVNTNIAVRDQRMRDFLFETAKFTQATFNAKVDLAFIEAMAVGDQKQLPLKGHIDLHGIKKEVSVSVQLVKLANDKVVVSALTPMIINAKDYGLAEGVAKLQKLASLPSISNAVPVSFVLTFTKG